MTDTEYMKCKGGCGKDIIKTKSTLCMNCFTKSYNSMSNEGVTHIDSKIRKRDFR
jgi:hypothetical protein